MNLLKIQGLIFLVLVAVSPVSWAHSVHQSTAEAEYNAVSKKLEVSLTVFLNDLEVALVRQCEREMRIDQTPEAEFDEQIVIFLSGNFGLKDSSGQGVRLEWVGRERDEGSAKSDEPTVTLYFQYELPEGLEDYRLRNTVFFDRFKDQRNLLLLRQGSQKVELLFSKKSPSRKLEFPHH